MARRALGPDALRVVQACRRLVGQLPGPVVVGCSGGPDSTALALGAAHLLGPDGWLVRVVDHGLQPGSDQVAAEVAARLAARGVPVEVAPVQVGGSGGPEAAAREARYAALRSPVDDCAPQVWVGHTLDDQAEGVLLGLARGSGPTSLAGMAPVSGDIIRPLLGLRRDETVAACEQWGVETWDDPHNHSSDYLRSRVRHEVMPVLAGVLGAGVPQALARTADLLRADAELLDHLADDVLATQPEGQLVCSELAALPAALRSRVLRRWLAPAGVNLTLERTRALEQLVLEWRGQGAVDLPGTRVARTDGRLVRVE